MSSRWPLTPPSPPRPLDIPPDWARPVVMGYAAVFDCLSTGEPRAVFRRGCFDSAIVDQCGVNVSHKSRFAFASSENDSLRMWVDVHGLRVAIRPFSGLNDYLARHVLISIRRGGLTHMSVTTRGETREAATQGGQVINEGTDCVELVDVTLTTTPRFAQTQIVLADSLLSQDPLGFQRNGLLVNELMYE